MRKVRLVKPREFKHQKPDVIPYRLAWRQESPIKQIRIEKDRVRLRGPRSKGGRFGNRFTVISSVTLNANLKSDGTCAASLSRYGTLGKV
jgi:hypothetical protein